MLRDYAIRGRKLRELPIGVAFIIDTQNCLDTQQSYCAWPQSHRLYTVRCAPSSSLAQLAALSLIEYFVTPVERMAKEL